jgi:hypothetical protein
MNELIKDLAAKAGFEFWADEHWKPEDAIIDWSCNYDSELEKFAKLIVKECVDHIMNSSDRHRKEYFAGMIKDHFAAPDIATSNIDDILRARSTYFGNDL